MKKTALLSKISLTKTAMMVALTFSATQSMAKAGFQINTQSATGLGRAFSGDAVIADNASVMARNVATMALFDKTSLSLGLNALITDISVSDASYTAITSPTAVDSNYSDAGGLSLAPNIHLIVPLNEKFAVGLDLYSNFGTRTEFDSSFTGAEYGGLTDVKSINLGLATSYRINEQWSVGGGLDVIYGIGKLQRSRSVYLGGTEALDADAAGFGLGFNVGTVFELDKNNRFGLSYHYSPELKAKGDITFGGTTVEDDTLYMPLPDMAEFSGYHHLSGTKFAVHYSVQWIGWSAFDTLDSKAFGVINEYHWKDAMHFSIGNTYYVNDRWTLRSGYMYDQSAQDEVTSISVPDSDRQWLSAGFTYHFTDSANIDFGATYLIGEDVSVTETTESSGTEVSSITGTTHADAILVALQYSQSF
ncbi:outer membrane protein transport protein [Psychromonas sp. KJ10-10]|uniref:outer membrane protein transport protein n=1 Tax=Psychromonas sp. KJ10-10 TaxID=3391823 RepID=UPI0039B532DE